jgi:hypothetical protein
MKGNHPACVSGLILSASLLAAVGTVKADSVLYQGALRSTGWVVVPRPGGLSAGTCWVADREQRLAVTCRHVVGDSREALVYFPRYEEGKPIVEALRYLREFAPVSGRVIASDPVRDLAVIRLTSLPAGVRQIVLSEQGCGPGDDIHSLGNSGIRGGLGEGSLWWYTRGSVRQVHRRKVKVGEDRGVVWMVETQAPVNEGDSGGPVVDSKGRLVGVTGSYTREQRLVSQNIDVREVRAFLKESTRPGRKEAEADARSPLGNWTVTGGTSSSGKSEFRADGTFLLSRSDRPVEGRYAYANGLLWIILKEGLASLQPTWRGKNRFRLKLGESELVFDRQVIKAVSRERATASRAVSRPHSPMQGNGLPSLHRRVLIRIGARTASPLR